MAERILTTQADAGKTMWLYVLHPAISQGF